MDKIQMMRTRTIGGRDTRSQLCKTSRNEHGDVKKIDHIIDQTVEEATLTKEVKERLKLLEGTEENGSKAAKIDPDLANRMLHNLKRESLAEKLRNTYRSVHSSLLTNCSLVRSVRAWSLRIFIESLTHIIEMHTRKYALEYNENSDTNARTQVLFRLERYEIRDHALNALKCSPHP